MPRLPKPFKHEGWFKTNAGGPPRTKLCLAEKGLRHAQGKLSNFLARIEEVRQRNLVPVGMTPAAYLRAVEEGTIAPPDEAVAPITAQTKSQEPDYGLLTIEVIDEFLDFKQVEADPSTYEHYVNKLKPFAIRFGNRPLPTITEEDGISYKRWLHKERRWKRKKGKTEQKGMAACSVNHCVRAARTLFNWAAKPSRQRKYGIFSNPWAEIKYLPEKGRERLLTEAEFASLLKRCRDEDFKEILQVLRYTTLRPGELRKMKWDYIRWDICQIVFPPEVIKTRKRRAITMIDQVETLLKNRQQRVGKNGDLVFPGPNGEEWGHSVFSQKFRRLRDRCVSKGDIKLEVDGERLVFYTTRHTRITEMYVEGHGTATVMAESGHKTHEMAERYKHLTAEYVAERVRKLSRLDAGV